MAIPETDTFSSSYERFRRHWEKKLCDAYVEILQKMGNAAQWLDNHPGLLLIFLLVVYASVRLRRAYTRPLWHDELFTYNVARSNSAATADPIPAGRPNPIDPMPPEVRNLSSAVS